MCLVMFYVGPVQFSYQRDLCISDRCEKLACAIAFDLEQWLTGPQTHPPILIEAFLVKTCHNLTLTHINL